MYFSWLLFFRISNLRSVKKYYLSTPLHPRASSQHTVWHVSNVKKYLLRNNCIQFYLLKGPFVSILHYRTANNCVNSNQPEEKVFLIGNINSPNLKVKVSDKDALVILRHGIAILCHETAIPCRKITIPCLRMKNAPVSD